MAILYEKMILMLIMMVLGYVAVQTHIVADNFNKSLSRLIINILLTIPVMFSVLGLG